MLKFLTQTVKQQLFSLIIKSHSSIRVFHLICFNITSNFILISCKSVPENEANRFCSPLTLQRKILRSLEWQIQTYTLAKTHARDTHNPPPPPPQHRCMLPVFHLQGWCHSKKLRSGLLTQLNMLPQHSDRSCTSNSLSHPATAYWHLANQSWCRPYYARQDSHQSTIFLSH